MFYHYAFMIDPSSYMILVSVPTRVPVANIIIFNHIVCQEALIILFVRKLPRALAITVF